MDPQGEDCISCNSLSFPYIRVCVPQTRWDLSTKPKEEEHGSAFEETKSAAEVSLAGNIKDGSTWMKREVGYPWWFEYQIDWQLIILAWSGLA